MQQGAAPQSWAKVSVFAKGSFLPGKWGCYWSSRFLRERWEIAECSGFVVLPHPGTRGAGAVQKGTQGSCDVFAQPVTEPPEEPAAQYLHITEAEGDVQGTQAAVAALQDLRYTSESGSVCLLHVGGVLGVRVKVVRSLTSSFPRSCALPCPLHSTQLLPLTD